MNRPAHSGSLGEPFENRSPNRLQRDSTYEWTIVERTPAGYKHHHFPNQGAADAWREEEINRRVGGDGPTALKAFFA